MFFFIFEVKNYLVQLCNKHYPIAECWMDDESDEQTLHNYKILDGRWWIDKKSTIITTTCHALDKFPMTF
jgi:hypothetical protein